MEGNSKYIYKKRNRYISNKNVFFRPWGKYTNLFKGENFLIKEIYVKSNAKLSLQKHFHRSEHWLIKKGLAHITLNNNIIIKKQMSLFLYLKDLFTGLKTNQTNLLLFMKLKLVKS